MEADRRDNSKEEGRGRWGALYTHNTHCTLKLILVSGIYVYKGEICGLVFVMMGELLREGWDRSSGATRRSGGSRRTDSETGVSGWNLTLL